MTSTEPEPGPLYPCLHHLESSMSLRVLCALEEIQEAHGLQYRLKIYHRSMRSQGTKEVHPLGKSPVLCIGPKPEQALTGARLEPDTDDKDRNVFFQEFANCSLLVKVDFMLISSLGSIMYPFGIRHLVALLNYPFMNHFRNDIKLYFQYMEDALSDSKPWFAGSRHGLADFNMIFPMDMASQRGYFDAKAYPKVQGWLERIHDLPCYRRALEKGGKYDLKNF